MKQKGLLLLVLVSMVLSVCAGLVVADEPQTSESSRQARIWDVFGYEDDLGEHHHLEGAFLDWFHKPADWIQMGFDLRLRTVFGRNIDTLDDKASNTNGTHRSSRHEFQRYRFRWWQKFMLSEDVDFNWRWVYEFRTWDKPERANQSFDGDEIIWDRFNFTVRNLFDMPLTMVAGRQDIILGGGWLVLDGTPLDGSRTIFFDALRFTYDWEDANTKLDVIYIHQGAASDHWLKPINDRDKYLTEQDENAVILWLTHKPNENMTIDAYYIYKNDNNVNTDTADNFPVAQWSRKASIHTFGGAISGNLNENWVYRGDLALQTGKRQARGRGATVDLNAYAAKARLGYLFNDEHKNEIHATYEFLSGDKPGSNDDEAFDPLWGEWPQWSELYIYTYSREGSIAETTNLHRFNVGHSFKPCERLTVATDYHALWADENTNTGVPGFVKSANHKFRGHLATLWLKYQCCAQLKAHMVFEYFTPGDYYAQQNRDGAYFFRLNFEYSF